MKKLLILLLFPLSAFGQVNETVGAFYSPLTWLNTTVTGTISLQDASGNTLSAGSTGQISFFQPTITVIFPVQPASVVVSRIRVDLVQSNPDGNGGWFWVHPLKTPWPLAAGSVPTVSYGTLTGSLVGTVSAPVVVVPPPPPPPPPPSITTIVTTVGGGPIVDTKGATWTFGPKNPAVEGGAQLVILRNGATNGAATEICLSGVSIYVMNMPGTVWYKWTDNAALARAGSFAQVSTPTGC